MRKTTITAVSITFLLTIALALPAAAQRGKAKAKGKEQNGPAFCRSGAGHPVYGRQWCIDRGFGLGSASWRKAQPGRIRFERVPRGRIETTRLGWREVAEILTDVALDEIFGESSHDLDRERLAGQWRGGDTEGLLVFELMLGDEPVAELTDLDLNGEVDVVLIAEH